MKRESADRSGGILIPATAQVGKRLSWAEVVAAGPNVRNMEIGDQVLFNPEDRYEVEVERLRLHHSCANVTSTPSLPVASKKARPACISEPGDHGVGATRV